MKTVKEILTENRDSVISSIKYAYKVWKNEDVKVIMVKFLAFANDNLNVEVYEKATAKKGYLKSLVGRMQQAEGDAFNMAKFGTTRPKLRDIMGAIADRNEDNGLVWNPMQKDWVKNDRFNASMSKY